MLNYMGKTIKADKIIPESGELTIVGIVNGTGIEYRTQWNDSTEDSNNINYTKGRVSLGTTDANSNLQVEGNVYVSSNLEVGKANLFVDTETSKVGIGTRTPLTTLHVEGNVYASSNIGIGTSTPKYTLDVHGTANVGALTANTISGDGYLLSNILASSVVGGVGVWTTNQDDTIYYQTASVAIGKTNPTTTLDVVGTVTATEFSGPLSGRAITATDADNASKIYVTAQTNQTDTRRIIFGPDEGAGNKSLFSDSKLNYVASSGTLTATKFVGGGGGITIPRLNTSNVSIGSGAGATSQSSSAVAIGNNAGNASQGSSAIAIGSRAGRTNQHDNTIILNASGSDLDSQGTTRFYVKPVRSGTITGSALAYTGTSEVVSETSLKFYDSGNVEVGTANLFVDTTETRVGIGKTNPGYTLDVNGDLHFSGGLYQNEALFVSTPWDIETNPDALSYTAGNVGIGASNPSAKLHVTGNASVSSNLEVGQANLFVDTLSSRVGVVTRDPVATLHVEGNVYASSNLEVGQANLFVDTLSSRVGVGTDNPNFTLDVNGDINFTGTFNQNGEEFESSPWTKSGDDLTYTTGHVGIGTTDTEHTLTVQGNFNIKNTMTTKLKNEPSWAERMSGAGTNEGNGIAVDSDGNVYVTGIYQSDAFIAKYGTDGNVIWAARISGSGSRVGHGIAVDSGGNVYVTGYYAFGDITLYSQDETTGTSIELANVENYDVFIAKYSTDGDLRWAARMCGAGADEGNGIAVDSDGNVYVTGRYTSDILTLYSQDETTGTSIELTNPGNDNAFIAKYSTVGNVLWAAKMGGSGYEEGNGIAVDSGGNVYVTGSYSSSPLILYNQGESTSSGIELTRDGNAGKFIAKYNTSGNVLWAARMGGSNSDVASGIAVDSGGNVYVTGYYYGGTFTLYNEGESTSTGIELDNVGDFDAFIAKYSTDGNVRWAARMGGDSTDEGNGIAVDNGGNVYVTGRYQSDTFTLYNQGESTSSGIELTNGGGYDVFIAKYSRDGVVLWAAKMGGLGYEEVNGIVVDSGGNVYVTGRYQSDTFILYNENESTDINLTGDGTYSVFIAKYRSVPRVGIGVKNPTSAIDVAGQVKANGTILTFTGQHICTPEGPMDQGLIVSANKNMYTTLNGPLLIGSRAIQSSESIPVVCLSSIENDPSVFGVVDHLENGGTQRLQDRGGIITKSRKIIGDDRVIINSLGEGAMWVVNTNGSLLSGDYITTSNISGYGHKQDDDILHSYTVAKITMDCDFNPNDLPIQVIKKDENGNNVLDKYGRLQWEDTDRVEKAYQVRYLTIEGEVTDESNAVHIAAYVGCTYHCG
jgi:hypothetical protein